LSFPISLAAQEQASPVLRYAKESAPVLVLEHVRLIDGTGAAPKDNVRIDLSGGKITAVQPSGSRSPYPIHAKVLDMKGKTVIPGLVGMHEHFGPGSGAHAPGPESPRARASSASPSGT
jgi:imidazolonepropionase-like amidohydrolase